MGTLRSSGRRWASIGATSVAVGGLVVGSLIGASPASAATPKAHPITVHPQVYDAGSPSPGATFGCQTRPMDGSAGARCYQASQIQNAYNITPLLDRGINGTGRTIVIVDAYGSPTIAADLQTFSTVMGLPDANLSVIAPAGEPPAFDPNDGNAVGWGVETSLDVEWAHATAPGANIVLAVAKSNEDADILATTKYVVDNNLGDVISQSYGEAESCMDPALLAQQHEVFAQAVAKGITLIASSGDSGASQPACTGDGALFEASTPASDPNVTGVGGTTLFADTSTGAYQYETAWTEPFGCNPPAVDQNDVNCSGGGFSSIYARPLYQSAMQKNAMRGVPDVAYNAGSAGGVLVHIQFLNDMYGLPATVFFIVGGTSAGTPQWAGIVADTDQLAGRRTGNINPALYSIAQGKKQYASALHDITTGTNYVVEIDNGYRTSTGWDAVTGLGSPNAANLAPLLVQRTS